MSVGIGILAFSVAIGCLHWVLALDIGVGCMCWCGHGHWAWA